MSNPNYATYLGTANQLQRWRDFLAHAAAYALFNLVFIAVWLATGRGTFWPVFPLIGWGIGLTFQHHADTWLGPITETKVRDRMTRSTDAAVAAAVRARGSRQREEPLRSGWQRQDSRCASNSHVAVPK